MKLLALILLLQSTYVLSAPLATLTKGMDRPECALLHGKFLYVSNMSGPGNARDNVGWINKLDRNGKMIQEKWVSSLHAPKGMKIWKDTLYVTDIDSVVSVDLKTSSVTRHPVPGAILLNDIALDGEGNLYVSDTFGSKIYFVNFESGKNQIEVFATLSDAPNGLYLEGTKLYVAGYGKSKADGTGMEDGPKGGLSVIDVKTKEVTSLVPELGRNDGLAMLPNGQLLLTLKGEEAIHWIDVKENKIIGTLKGATSLAVLTDVADIDFDAKTKILYVPNTRTHDVQLIQLK